MYRPYRQEAISCSHVQPHILLFLITRSTILIDFYYFRFSLNMEMSRLTRDGTAEPVSRDQILRHARGQGNIHFPCSADHEQDWQPYPVDPYSAICDDHTYILRFVSFFFF